MAQMSFEDFMSYGYTFPGTGGSLVITITQNEDYVHSFEISGVGRSNIVSFSATEDGNEVEVVEFEPGAYYAVQLNATGEYVEITIEVSESPSPIDDNYSFETIFDYDGQQTVVIGQDGYTPPTPVWEDGQHKIYRSGNLVNKMYRSGELIYLRLNPASEEPEPPTPTYQWVEVTSGFDRTLAFTKVRWATGATWNDGFFSELPNINCDGQGWTGIQSAEWGYAGWYTQNLNKKKFFEKTGATSYATRNMSSPTCTLTDDALTPVSWEYEYQVPLYWGGMSNTGNYTAFNGGTGLYVYVKVTTE